MNHCAKLKNMWRPRVYFCVALLALSAALCRALEVEIPEIRPIPNGPVPLPAGARVQSGPGDDLAKLTVSRDGKFAATVSRGDAKLRVWDAATAKLVATIDADKGESGGVDFAADGKTLFSCGETGAVYQWDIATGKEIRKFDGHDDHIGTVAVSPDGLKIASTDAGSIRIWDIKTGNMLQHMTGHKVPGELLSPVSLSIDSIGFSPDGRILVSEANDETARLWDVLSGRELRVLPQHDGSVAAVAVSPAGDVGASTRGGAAAGSMPRVRIWEVSTGKIRRVLTGHQGDITCVAFSPDGRYVYSGSHDRSLRQWEVDSGAEIRRFTLASPPMAVRCGTDGKTAFTISANEGLVVWDVTGAPLSKRKIAVESLDQAWKQLSSREYDERTAALNFYLAQPAQAVADLGRRLQQENAVEGDAGAIAKLIQLLDDKSYPVRAKAYDDLEQLGAQARPALVAALEHASAEVRVRAAALLNAIGGTADFRPVLAVEVLSLIKTPQAAEVLKKLAANPVPCAAHAKAALAR